MAASAKTVVVNAAGSGSAPIRDVRLPERSDATFRDAEGFVVACVADYADLRARWGAIEEKYRPELERIERLPNYYAQRDALAELAHDYRSDLNAARLDAIGVTADYVNGGGLAYDVDRLLAALGRKRVITRRISIFKAAYPPAENAIVAGDAYCIEAVAKGTHRTNRPAPFDFAATLPPERAAAAHAYLVGRTDRIARDMAIVPPPATEYEEVGLSQLIASPGVAEGTLGMTTPGSLVTSGGSIGSLRRSATGVTIRIRRPDGLSVERRCPLAETDCAPSVKHLDLVYQLELPDAPLALAAGDWIDFDAILVRQQNAATAVTLELRGTLVRRVASPKHPGDTEPAETEFDWLYDYEDRH